MQTLEDDQKKGTAYDDIDNRVDALFLSQNNNSQDYIEKKKKKKTKIGIKRPCFKRKKVKKEKKLKQNKKPVENNKIEEEFLDNEKIDKKDDNFFSSNKKTELVKKNMKGKPVYLEDTGEKLGVVYDSIYDETGKIMGYRLKDDSSNAVLTFPLDQFDEDKKGLIFIPSWYTKALKTVEKLEFKDRVSPELTALLTDDEEYNKELYQVFIKHDNEMADFIDQTISLKEMLSSHLKVLERKREDIKENLMDLTERRLIKDIDRREFAEDVMEHRRKVNILEVNISKCKNLLKRLDSTSFGVLGKNFLALDENELKVFNNKNDTKNIETINVVDDQYKEKYLSLKEKFEDLENQYELLKNSVEKIIK